MTDIELTALAAKACGEMPAGFSPLTDDGDAFRLAVKLDLWVHPGEGEEVVTVVGVKTVVVSANGDRDAATRRAIVRAAAEIGRQM